MGIIQRKLLKNKGIILMELILTMGLITIIISMIIPIFLKLNYSYYGIIENDRNYFYVQEALLYIKNEMTQNTLICDVEDNKIKINKLDGTKKEIYLANKRESLADIVITYYKNEYSTATNNILKNITDFKILKKDNVIYIGIITKDGKKYERCWALNP